MTADDRNAREDQPWRSPADPDPAPDTEVPEDAAGSTPGRGEPAEHPDPPQ